MTGTWETHTHTHTSRCIEQSSPSMDDGFPLGPWMKPHSPSLPQPICSTPSPDSEATRLHVEFHATGWKELLDTKGPMSLLTPSSCEGMSTVNKAVWNLLRTSTVELMKMAAVWLNRIVLYNSSPTRALHLGSPRDRQALQSPFPLRVSASHQTIVARLEQPIPMLKRHLSQIRNLG